MDWLEGVTSISREDLAGRLERTCQIIREELPPAEATEVLARMVIVWGTHAPARWTPTGGDR
jgi:hypothetical protein